MVSGKSDALLGEAANELEIPFCCFDACSLRIHDVNDEMSKALGYSVDALQAMTLEELLVSDEAAAFRDATDGLGERFADMGVWHLRLRSGAQWSVAIRGCQLAKAEPPRVFATMQDASPRVGQWHGHGQEANLRHAQKLLGIGIWKLEIATGRQIWSENIYRICGLPPGSGEPGFDGLLAMIHPDDRPGMIAELEAFRDSNETIFEFHHRILRPDGRTVHVRGIAERVGSGEDAWLTGVLQDVTDEVHARDKLSEASRMQRIAGGLARMGAWRVDLDPPRMTWSAETAAIHELPEGTTLSVAEGIDYYAPEFRETVRNVFNACVTEGMPFDEMLQIVTAKGNRLWVRTIGEAMRDDAGRIVAVHGAFQDVSELVAARTKAEDLSRRLRDTLESISDGFVLLDHDWRFLFVNAQAERIVGRNREELLGKNNWEVFPEAVGTIVQHEYERALETGKPVRFRSFFPPLSIWFEIDAEPTPEGLAVYFRDVTQERAREEKLRLLEMAVARQSDILMITEAEPIDAPDGPKIVHVNEAFVRRTGYCREEAIGATPHILQGPRTDRAELDRIRQALQKWHPVRAELINYTKTGEEYWIELDIVPIADENGWYTHWVAVERDITDRKRAEEENLLYQERFQLVTQATNDVIWDWDLKTGRHWWNENLQVLFGYDVAKIEPGPESWENRLHPEDKDAVVASINALIAGSESFWSGEYRFRHADGHYLTVIDRSFVIRDAEGKATRMLGSLVDVSEQRELESRLRQAQKLEAVGQITGGVAHDFNNLLTVILGNAELLADGLEDQAPLRQLAERTIEAAERGAELTNRLLSFARKQPLQPRVLDVAGLVQGMESLLRRSIPESIDVRVVCAADLWRAEIDTNQLEAALFNLALNARDAMPKGGALAIDVSNVILDDAFVVAEPDLNSGHYVMITVTDSGTGMEPAVLNRVFEPFFTTKEAGKGTGLGLSMVYGFVKQSRGHIQVSSEPGTGTHVTLYFPRSANADAGSQTDSAGHPIVGGAEVILVVEDNEMVRQQLVTSLVGLGYQVEAAETGPEALDILQDMPKLDLLLTDVVLPGGMNGRKLADEACRLRPGLRVLFTSGYSEDALVHHGRLDPEVELLSKPYRRDQLAIKLRMVLDQA